MSDARFHPSGKKIIATKWYTSDRSIPAGEGWEYEVPSSKTEIQAGSGQRVVGRTLPRGWDIEEYGELQVGPEQFIWNGEGGLIYAKNVIDESEFNYSKGQQRPGNILHQRARLTFCRRSFWHLFHIRAQLDDKRDRDTCFVVSGWCFATRAFERRAHARFRH